MMGTNKKTAPCGNTERKATGYDAFFNAVAEQIRVALGLTETRTFSKRRVVTADNGAEIAVVTMSITTLRGFQTEHTEALLEQFAKTCRSFYLETGNTLKTES